LNKANESGGSIALVDLHDARVESLLVSVEGLRASVVFASVLVYHAIKSDEYEIWNHPATLEIEGVHDVRWSGQLETDDYLMEGAARLGDQTVLEWTQLTRRSKADSVQLRFFGGSDLLMSCESVELILGAPAAKVDKWSGPLK
jgi:hypothetical protein